MIPALLHILAMTGAYAIGREIRDHHLGNWIRHACEYAYPDASPRFWDVVLRSTENYSGPCSFTVWAAITIALSTQLVLIRRARFSWLATFVAIWLMMLVSLWMGVIVTTLSMSLRMGLSMTGFITAPAFAFAGVGFPTFAMPIGARIWANLVLLTHYPKLQINQLQNECAVLVGDFFIADSQPRWLFCCCSVAPSPCAYSATRNVGGVDDTRYA